VNIAGRERIEIAAPPESLWQMVSDVTRTKEWSPDVVMSAWVPPWTGPVVGAQFESTNHMPFVGRWRSRSTVTASDPGRRFAFAVGRNPADPNTTWAWDFEPAAGGTIVRLRYEMHREPRVVLLYYLLTGRREHVRRSVATTLQRLKDAAEGPAIAG